MNSEIIQRGRFVHGASRNGVPEAVSYVTRTLPLMPPHDEFSNEFDAMFAQMARRSRNDRFVPNTDVYLSEDERVLIQVELAGVDPESLRVHVEDRALYIEGRREPDMPWRRGNCVMKEIEYGDFERKMHLPVAVDQREAAAVYHDGILSIALPIVRDPEFPITRTEIRLVLKRVTK